MLVKVQDLSPEKQNEFMDLIDFYKNDGKLRQTLSYSCHQDNLLSSKKHTNYNDMFKARAKSLPGVNYHEYVSMKDDEIIGIMFFVTLQIGDKHIGNEMFVWRVQEKPTYTFGKDLKEIGELYESMCHMCHEIVIYGDTTKEYELKYGSVFMSLYPGAAFFESTIRCRDSCYRPVVRVIREGKL